MNADFGATAGSDLSGQFVDATPAENRHNLSGTRMLHASRVPDDSVPMYPALQYSAAVSTALWKTLLESRLAIRQSILDHSTYDELNHAAAIRLTSLMGLGLGAPRAADRMGYGLVTLEYSALLQISTISI
jgi:hypothetical protein